MARALRSMTPDERKSAIQRRLRNSFTHEGRVVGGLGYWGAVDAQSNSHKSKEK